MTYPPQRPHPGNPAPYGPGPQYPSQPAGRQGVPGQQGFPGQGHAPNPAQPQPAWGGPVQPPGWSGQPGRWQPAPTPPGGPGSKLPLVLIGGAVVLVIAIIAVVALGASGGDKGGSIAATTNTTVAQSTSSSSESAPTTTKSSAVKPTTPAKAQQPVPASLQPVVDALPAAVRQAVLKNSIRERPADTMFGYDAAAGFTLSAHDALLSGLMRHPDNDYYPTAYITTKPDYLKRIWTSQHPDWLSDEGSRLVRIDPGSQNSKGTATVEIFLPASNLYFSLSTFDNADAARQFVQRAGF